MSNGKSVPAHGASTMATTATAQLKFLIPVSKACMGKSLFQFVNKKPGSSPKETAQMPFSVAVTGIEPSEH